jgi:hypothetical protein
MAKYLIQRRDTGFYVDQWRGLHQGVAQALGFHSVEEAEFYRVQIQSSREQYETCELTAGGQVIPVQIL